jgi:hypothetical protein
MKTVSKKLPHLPCRQVASPFKLTNKLYAVSSILFPCSTYNPLRFSHEKNSNSVFHSSSACGAATMHFQDLYNIDLERRKIIVSIPYFTLNDGN